MRDSPFRLNCLCTQNSRVRQLVNIFLEDIYFMKTRYLLFYSLLLLFASQALAQQNFPAQVPVQDISRFAEPVENMSRDISKINKSVEEFNKNMKSFFESFSSNQGLKLSEKQQKLLLAFEILNRSEQRLANLQRLKLDLTEKQTALRLQLARITDDMLPESLDRYVSTRGTTNAEQLREIRRQALMRERTELSSTLNDIFRSLQEMNIEINKTEMFLQNIRQRIFPEIEKELSDL